MKKKLGAPRPDSCVARAHGRLRIARPIQASSRIPGRPGPKREPSVRPSRPANAAAVPTGKLASR